MFTSPSRASYGMSPMGILDKIIIPDSNVYGANMGPTWVPWVPDGAHVGPTNLSIRDAIKIFDWMLYSKAALERPR